MRLMVIAAERAETMATMIHKIWRRLGHACAVKRAASSAPVSAKGSANTECSNLIISSTVRIRPAIAASGLGFLRFKLRAGPAIHLFLRKSDLREDAANVLRDEVINRFRMVIKRRHRGHDDGSGGLRAHHVLQVNAAERRVSNAEDELAALLEHHVGGARDQVIARAVGDRRKAAHRTWDDNHGVEHVAAG